ncbi:MAG: hypothetical protein KDE69_02975, partial [Burkholderiaceae bacterium]|nr:hypothetical protein [Burkholderiaceae bacterium]
VAANCFLITMPTTASATSKETIPNAMRISHLLYGPHARRLLPGALPLGHAQFGQVHTGLGFLKTATVSAKRPHAALLRCGR